MPTPKVEVRDHDRRRGDVMGAHVHLNVPPAAQTARLVTRNRRWGISYRSRLGETEGSIEFRQIDPKMLDADHVDHTDPDAVIAHVEHRLWAAGFDASRTREDGEPFAASWDIRPRRRA
jgi:hypothetical protein